MEDMADDLNTLLDALEAKDAAIAGRFDRRLYRPDLLAEISQRRQAAGALQQPGTKRQ